MITYTIYLLKCGKCLYVGSSRHFKRRYAQHSKDLKLNRHVNNCLQREYNKGHKVEYKILYSGKTLFNQEILRTEQRYILKYANANESVASKQVTYSKKEFIMDLTDWIVNNWKLISCIIFIVLIFGFTMTPEQALNLIDMLVQFWSN